MSREALKIGVLRALVWVLPARPHAVVTGSPDDEGNSVEMVRTLSGRMPVYWLVTEEPASLTWLVEGAADPARVTCLRKESLRAHLAYVTARYVFFTHGLYGSPKPPRRKTFVNIWHGDGPKRRKGFARIRSTVVVSGTRLWGSPRAKNFEVGDQGVLVTGNPRVDQFARAATDDNLRALGLSPDRPLVLWMPTYRTTEYRGRRMGTVRDWSDGQELSDSRSVRDVSECAGAAAQALGIDLLVKPHPLDADRFTGTGIRRLSNQDLRNARTTLYQLLGRTSGLITDYSSVWTDYLAMDRPVGFYCPDLDEYDDERGLNVDDYPSLLPGPLMETIDDFEQFLRACLEEPAEATARRRWCIDHVGAETRLGAAERLLDALGIPAPVSRVVTESTSVNH